MTYVSSVDKMKKGQLTMWINESNEEERMIKDGIQSRTQIKLD